MRRSSTARPRRRGQESNLRRCAHTGLARGASAVPVGDHGSVRIGRAGFDPSIASGSSVASSRTVEACGPATPSRNPRQIFGLRRRQRGDVGGRTRTVIARSTTACRSRLATPTTSCGGRIRTDALRDMSPPEWTELSYPASGSWLAKPADRRRRVPKPGFDTETTVATRLSTVPVRPLGRGGC